jgi:hypothetical protein
MLVSRFSINACCGTKSLVFKTSRPIAKTDIDGLVPLGFTEAPNFTKAGILYLDNQWLIITGPIGADRLTVKCKGKDCDQKVNDLEELLKQLP